MSPADLVRLFVRHRNAANLLMVVMLVLGAVSLSRLNTQFFPDFGIDMVSINVVWPGASAEDVEANIVTAIEPEVRYLNDVDHVESFAVEGSGTVLVKFNAGSDMQAGRADVVSAVAQVTTLPEGSETPIIRRVARFDTISRIALSGPFSESALKAIAKRIREGLLARGIDQVLMFGARDEEIWVDMTPRALRRLGLSLDDIADRIRSRSQDLPSGNIEGQVEKQIRSLGLVTTAAGLGEIEIRSLPNGEKIRLRDVAKVREAFDDEAPEGRLSADRAIELHVKRAVGADALDISQTVEDYLAELRLTLPPTLTLEHYDVQAGLIRERINILLKNGLGGLVLVLIILFIFLNLRVAIWVAAGIPVALMATMGVMLLSGQSINMVSLFALIMTLGIIVDDAIVVGEHSASRRRRGLDPTAAAEEGALRMLAPVVASSLTTIAAFLPLFMIGGIIGTILGAIPLVTVSVLIASLVECFLVLPGHLRGALLHGRSEESRPRAWFNHHFDRFRGGPYRRILEVCVRWRYLTLASAVAALILALGIIAGGRIGFQFFPTPEGDIVYGNVVMMPGTPRQRTEAMVRELERAAHGVATQFPDQKKSGEELIHSTFGKLGRTQANEFQSVRGDKYGGLYVQLAPSDHRQVRMPDFIAAWRSNIEMQPGVERVNLNERRGGPPGKEIDIRLSGGSTRGLKDATREIKVLLGRFPGVSDVEDDLPYGKQEVILELTPRGRALGFSTDSVGRQVRAAFQGATAKRFPRGDEEVTVKVQYARGAITTEDLLNLYLGSPSGVDVPLSEVVSMRESAGFARIRRKDGKREIAITGELDESKIRAGKLIEALEDSELPNIARRYGLQYSFAGRAEEQARTMADMRLGALVGMAAIYIILAWVFSSYTRPIVVMAVIPFGVIGAVIGHLLLGFDLSLLTLVGLLGLSGILVNDSIILVSTIDERISAGEETIPAIVAGSQDRLRAVMLTSLTTIGGLTPLLFETSLQAQFLIPMAITMIFGLAFATVLVLLVIPALIAIQLDVHNLRQRRRDGAALRQAKWEAFRAATAREKLLAVLGRIERTVAGIGFWSALVILPLMICVRVFEIVARKVFGYATSFPQYLEWELFVFLVLLTLGYAYVRGAHVRVDVIRERLSPRARNRIELIGLLLLMLPFALVVVYYGIPYTAESYQAGEKLALGLGAPGRWLLKGAMPFGIGLFLLAALVAAVRNLAQRLPKEQAAHRMFEFVDILPYVMLASLAILIFSGLPVAVLLAGLGVGFCLIGIAIGEMPVIALLNIPLRIYGSINGSLIYPTVPMLLFMGMALEKSGIARDLLLALQHILGRVPAGMAIAVTLLGILLAPTAGVIGASVATLALIALPTMLEQGYRPSLASGVVAAAGTLGLILPPAIMLFFLAGRLRVTIGHMFLAALWPAAILIVLYLIYYVIAAWRSPPKHPDTSAADHWSHGWSPWQWLFFYLRGLVLPAGLIFLVLGSIIFAWATPPQSGAVGAAGGLLLMLLNGRLSWPLFREVIEGTALMTAMVFFVVLAANVFSYPFRFFSGDEVVSNMLGGLAFGDWGMLLTIIGIIFILGFFIDWIEITIITLPLFMPVLRDLDFSAHLGPGGSGALWMATLIALTLQTSFLTPPFGFALFFLKGAAPPEVKIGDIYRGIIPIVGAQLLVISLVLTFPLLANWLPNQVFN